MEESNKLDPEERKKITIKQTRALIDLIAKVKQQTPLQVSRDLLQKIKEIKINNQQQNSEPYPSNRLTDEEMKKGFKKDHQDIRERIQKMEKD